MTLSFQPVTTHDEIVKLSKMAAEIWNEYWPALIGQEQTNYMVEMFHSVSALENDIANNNYRYWILSDETGREVGYTGGATEELTGDAKHDAHISHSPAVDAKYPKRFFISKIYLYASERGKHYSSEVLNFYEKLIVDEGLPAMYLTVNRDNELGVRAYLGRGFYIIEDVDNPIGEGYVMTDHIMVKEA